MNKNVKIAKKLIRLAKSLVAGQKKYLVMYNPKDRSGNVNYDDVEKCWVYADSPEDAEDQARDDNWDIGEVVDVCEL